MNCPKCKIIEMRVEKVEDDIIHYKCKNCGEEEKIDIKELEKNEKSY